VRHRPVVLLVCAAMAGCGTSDEPDEPGSTDLVDSGVVEVVAEGVISTSENQTFPSEDPLSGDLWFSVIGDSFDEQSIMMARRTGNGWAPPEVASFSGTWGDRAPRFHPDGSFLLFTSNRPRPGSSGLGDMNVWRVERNGHGGWSDPELVDGPINSVGSDIHPSVTAAGVWVASNRDGGFGLSDLYRVDEGGGVEHLGSPLNDDLSQPDLWVSPDETWMILAITDHPDGFGGDDLYVSRFESGVWTEPVNLGPEINTEEYEYGPWITADGEHLLFTSHRDGSSHVYRAPIRLVHEAMVGG